MKTRILIVEDDAALSGVLQHNLTFEGFDCESASDGRTAISKSKEFHPDLVLLDVMLPDTSGFELCSLFSAGGKASIIILTARGQKADKLRGLAGGADDYITKPFDLEELMARIRAVLRRARSAVQQIELGEVLIDFQTRVATRRGRRVQLTEREFYILQLLVERRGRAVHRDEVLREIWGFPSTPFTRSVDHAISRLRKKIEPDPHHPRFIHTVRGDGYCMTFGEPPPDS